MTDEQETNHAVARSRSNAGLGVTTEKCSHGIPLFEKDARCIDCEIKWERMVIAQAAGSVAKAANRLKVLVEEKRRMVMPNAKVTGLAPAQETTK